MPASGSAMPVRRLRPLLPMLKRLNAFKRKPVEIACRNTVVSAKLSEALVYEKVTRSNSCFCRTLIAANIESKIRRFCNERNRPALVLFFTTPCLPCQEDDETDRRRLAVKAAVCYAPTGNDAPASAMWTAPRVTMAQGRCCCYRLMTCRLPGFVRYARRIPGGQSFGVAVKTVVPALRTCIIVDLDSNVYRSKRTPTWLMMLSIIQSGRYNNCAVDWRLIRRV